MINRKKIYAILGAYIFLIFPSPIFSNIFGSFHLISLLSFGSVATTILLIYGLPKKSVLISLAIIGTGLTGSLISQSISQLGIALIIISSLNIGIVFNSKIQSKAFFATLNTSIILILLGAAISLLYFFLGGTPTGIIQNPDSRDNLLFLTSFSNTLDYELSGMIRPGGIYDEPGALSFAVVLVVILNELVNPRSRIALLIMLLGLLSLSLTHLLITAIYLNYFFSKFNWATRLQLLAITITSFGLLMNGTHSESALGKSLLNRLHFENGSIRGDNRSSQIESFFYIASNDVDISTKGHRVIDRTSGMPRYSVDQSSNPFTTWFNYGVTIWLLYLITLILIAFTIFRHRNKSNLALCGVLLILLLLQRPFVHDPMWAPAVWISIVMFFSLSRSEVKSKESITPHRSRLNQDKFPSN